MFNSALFICKAVSEPGNQIRIFRNLIQTAILFALIFELNVNRKTDTCIKCIAVSHSGKTLVFAWDSTFSDYDKALLPAFRVNPAIKYLQYDVAYTVERNASAVWYWNLGEQGVSDLSHRIVVTFDLHLELDRLV